MLERHSMRRLLRGILDGYRVRQAAPRLNAGFVILTSVVMRPAP